MQFDNSNRLRDVAVKVASGFLARGEAMTSAVVKVAQQQGLNSDQARRVCERANHMVHAALRKQASTVDFDVADPQAVNRQMGVTEKVATRYFDPVAPLTEKTASERDPYEIEVAEREAEFEKIAAAERHDMSITGLREDETLADGAYAYAQEGLFDEFMKMAADGDDLAEAMEEIAQYPMLASQPDAMVCVARLVKAAHLVAKDRPVEFTARTMEILGSDDGLEKVASELDPELTNPGLQISGMPVTFVRGKHAIWTSVDTLLSAYMTAISSHDAVARAMLSPDHTKPAPMGKKRVTNRVDRDITVAGRTV